MSRTKDQEDDVCPCEECEQRKECFGVYIQEHPPIWRQSKACWVFEHWCDTGRTLENKTRRPTRAAYLRLYPQPENEQ